MLSRAYEQGVKTAAAKYALDSANLGHLAEVAGLGILAAPSIHHFLSKKEMNPDKAHAIELGGLGVLAAPSAYHLIQSLRKR